MADRSSRQGARSTRPGGGPPRRRALGLVAALALLSGLVSTTPALARRAAPTCGTGDPAVDAGSCTVTIDARDFGSGSSLEHFNYLINVDNTKLPTDPLALQTQSNSPIVREGDEARNQVTLPNGRYLISVRSTDHKMWGAYVTLPDDADADGNLTETIELTEQSDAHPLPLGKIRVFVFNDNAWTNGAPDTEEAGLSGFTVGLEDQIAGEVTTDYNNLPLCEAGNSGSERGCLTSGEGFMQINDLGPATYFIDVTPPDRPCNDDPSSRWYQTTTIDGGLTLIAPTEEGADGTGAPGEQLWEPPNARTAYWFGFVCSPTPFAAPGTGEIIGTARNWVEWAPYTTGTYTDPVENAFVALSDASTDQTVFVDQGDAAGNFDIQNVPAGDYNLSIWDEQLSYIMRFKSVHVDDGQVVDVDETGDDGSAGVGVSRWFGWLDGTTYKDDNNNGRYDPGVDTSLANTDMDQRWRDGSIKESTVTGPDGSYEYPTAEGGALGRWIVNEQGFSRFSAFPGPSIHDEHTGDVIPSCAVEPPAVPANPCVPTDQGGGLLGNQLLLEGHRATVDWGKRDYPDGMPGQIVGITYFATTRNEFDAQFQAHEDYEPAVPDVTVNLETPGPDDLPNTPDDVLVNQYVTDHWQQPTEAQDPQANGNAFTQSCNPIRDFTGQDITAQLNPDLGPNCLEVPLVGEQTKDGAFDGGYAFADYCPNGFDESAPDPDNAPCWNAAHDDHVATEPLDAGRYITHAIMPTDPTDTRTCNPGNDGSGFKDVSGPFGDEAGAQGGCLYRIVREEDVNVDLGNHFTSPPSKVPPQPCVGDPHVIDQSTLTPRSTYYTGDQSTSPTRPLCDKRLVVLQNGLNANADFYLMTNFPTDPNGEDPSDVRVGDVAAPGRLVGQVFNDIYFDRNMMSNWYGEPRPIGGIPVGIYARVDTVPNVSCPDPSQPGVRCFDPNAWRLLKTVTTSPDGSFEVLVPSTETFNCPIPQGPCPGMYLVTVDDPGTKAHPNPTFDPNLLVATTPAEAWPGLSTQLDLPLDPISGTACQDPAGGTTPDPSDPARPDVLQVDLATASHPIADAPASSPVVVGAATDLNRRVAILSDFIGTPGPTNLTGARVFLTDDRTGFVSVLSQANGGIVSWVPGSGSNPDRIVIRVPAINTSTFRPGPKQVTLITSNANGSVTSLNGITLHVTGANGSGGNRVAYTPPVVTVPPPPPVGSNPHALQDAIDAAAPHSVLVLSPGTYNENVLVWKPLVIQGLGPGGVVGAHELQGRDPEDPRFNISGSVIDGRYTLENLSSYDATVAAHAPYVLPPFTNGNPSSVLRGATLTVAAQTTTAFDVPTLPAGQDSPGFSGARLDGLGIATGHGDGAGGIQLQASINNLQVTNNILENNGGVFAGGIGLGQPYVHGSHNYNVRVSRNRLTGNGGLTTSGGIGIFYGSNNYEVSNSAICSNFSVEYGAGISHIGLSPGGSIHDNRIYYNEAVDSGGGVAVESELPSATLCAADPNVPNCLGDGTGTVNIDRNLIQSNVSTLDDGGGVFVMDALDAPVNIRNDMIVDNLAADLGGAIMIDDSSNVRVINDTIANNVTTGSSESSDGNPHGAGLSTEANDSRWQVDPRYVAQYPDPSTRPTFSNPVALFNNLFWNNDAMTLDSFGPGAALVDHGFIDFEIHGTTNPLDTFTPRYSDLTTGQILGPDGVQRAVPGGQSNLIGSNPTFVTPFILQLAVSGSRLDPQQAAVTITGQDPPVGLTGDYHILAGSPAIDRGAGFSNLAVPAPQTQTPTTSSVLASCSGTAVQFYPADIDRQWRPQLRVTARVRTPWDLGADELPGVGAPPPRVLVIPGTYNPSPSATFNWNTSGLPLCSGSTEIRLTAPRGQGGGP